MAEGLKGLEEVKADAEYNYKKRLRDEQEKKAYEASKHASPAPVVETPKGSK